MESGSDVIRRIACIGAVFLASGLCHAGDTPRDAKVLDVLPGLKAGDSYGATQEQAPE